MCNHGPNSQTVSKLNYGNFASDYAGQNYICKSFNSDLLLHQSLHIERSSMSSSMAHRLVSTHDIVLYVCVTQANVLAVVILPTDDVLTSKSHRFLGIVLRLALRS